MERKDRLIQTLMKATEDSDDQHRRAFQAHTETLSYFLGIEVDFYDIQDLNNVPNLSHYIRTKYGGDQVLRGLYSMINNNYY